MYTTVLSKFESFFQVRKNVIFERACFNRRVQKREESVEQYIAALHRLADTCNYGDLTEDLIRDRLVVGIRDTKLSSQLQMDPNLKLETAMTKVRQNEAAKEQRQQLQAGDSKADPIVLEVNRLGGANRARRQSEKPPILQKPSKQSKCKRCGKNHQSGTDNCPAKDAQCFRCNRKGHFSSQCLSKTVAATESRIDAAYLDVVQSDSEQGWSATVQVTGIPVLFKLDTGAEVTAISEEIYKTLSRVTLKKPSRVLYGPAQQPLKVQGEFTAKMSFRDKSSQETVFVVKGLQQNLLGLPAIKALHLVSRVDTVVSTKQEVEREFPGLFQGLGNLGEPYTIQLKADSKPHAIYTPRNVPIPLQERVRDELIKMENAGVISKVSQPTEWCAGMVVVPKRSGALRICVDLKPLNENVLREVYPIPTVTNTLAHLAGAQRFSKIDANSGFWQIPLAPETRLLTTFLTPFGRYCFNKLPFGITSAPEVFQKRMSTILDGLDGVLCHMDDVLIFGANQEEHDRNLTAMLTRLQAAGVTLNASKCEFNREQVKFLGHMSDTEKRYAQIEKEALASTWACEKFADYLLGLHFLIESDHKPLIPLLGNKCLESLPPRVLRFRLRLARFDYSITHVPGKLLYTADTLSRAPLQTFEPTSLSPSNSQEEVEAFIEGIVSTLPASESRLEVYRTAQQTDPICKQVRQYCLTGWPEKKSVEKSVIPYWHKRSHLSIGNDILLHGSQIVVPHSLRKETLEKIHHGHQGIVRCRLRMKNSVWWPGASTEIAQRVDNCAKCAKVATPRKEPLISSPTPDYPWQVVGSDLFELNGTSYLLVVDYLSRFPEVVKLTRNTTSSAIISLLKSIFSQHGIPEVLRSDNGPQYASEEIQEFAKQYGFKLVTSSPRYPQSNGFIERMVKTVKQLFSQSDDQDLALLTYRSTPLPWCGYSPAELSMGRNVRTPLPQTKDHLVPTWFYLSDARKHEELFKRKQKHAYDRRHRVKELPMLPEDTSVWVKSGDVPVSGRVIAKSDKPRSYLVETPTGTLRRNRSHLGVDPTPPAPPTTSPRLEDTRTIMTRSKTGTTIHLPVRFRED